MRRLRGPCECPVKVQVNVHVDEENGHHVARWANGVVYGRVLLLMARTLMAYPLDAEGVWCEVSPRCNRGGPALFLDRDGVVVEEVDYLHRVNDIAICPSAAAVIAAANANAVPVVLVTNQAGVGRGYYGWAEFHAVQEAILLVIAEEG